MKTRSHLLKGCVLGLLLALPLMMFAQQGNQGPGQMNRGNRMGPNSQRLTDRLPGITDQQRQDIQKIQLATRRDIMPLRNQVFEKSARLRTLNTAEKPDTKAIDATLDEVSALRNQIAKRRMQSHQEIRKLLTDEQRVIFDSQPMGGGQRNGGQRGMR